MKRLLVAALITEADDADFDPLFDALKALKVEGTEGELAAFDVTNPINLGVDQELRSLDLEEVANEVARLVAPVPEEDQ